MVAQVAQVAQAGTVAGSAEARQELKFPGSRLRADRHRHLVLVAEVIREGAARYGGSCFFSRATIAARAARRGAFLGEGRPLSVKTISRLVAALEAGGVITCQRQRRRATVVRLAAGSAPILAALQNVPLARRVGGHFRQPARKNVSPRVLASSGGSSSVSSRIEAFRDYSAAAPRDAAPPLPLRRMTMQSEKKTPEKKTGERIADVEALARRRADRRLERPANTLELEALWRREVAKAHPAALLRAWTVKELGMGKALLRLYGPEKAIVWLTFVARKWKIMGQSTNPAVRHLPAEPSFEWAFLRHDAVTTEWHKWERVRPYAEDFERMAAAQGQKWDW